MSESRPLDERLADLAHAIGHANKEKLDHQVPAPDQPDASKLRRLIHEAVGLVSDLQFELLEENTPAQDFALQLEDVLAEADAEGASLAVKLHDAYDSFEELLRLYRALGQRVREAAERAAQEPEALNHLINDADTDVLRGLLKADPDADWDGVIERVVAVDAGAALDLLLAPERPRRHSTPPALWERALDTLLADHPRRLFRTYLTRIGGALPASVRWGSEQMTTLLDNLIAAAPADAYRMLQSVEQGGYSDAPPDLEGRWPALMRSALRNDGVLAERLLADPHISPRMSLEPAEWEALIRLKIPTGATAVLRLLRQWSPPDGATLSPDDVSRILDEADLERDVRAELITTLTPLTRTGEVEVSEKARGRR